MANNKHTLISVQTQALNSLYKNVVVFQSKMFFLTAKTGTSFIPISSSNDCNTPFIVVQL